MAGSGESTDPGMMELFRSELDIHLPVLGEGLLALEKDAQQPKLLEAMMRAAHSIKGAARIVGVDQAVRVAHVMEDCFVAAQKGEIRLSSEATDVLLRGVDFFTRLSQSGGGIETLSEASLHELVQAITGVRTGARQPAASHERPSSTAAAAVAEPAPTKVEKTNLEAGLIQEFISESREHLATVNEDLLHLEREGPEKAEERIDRLFRAMHSVKGGAALVGCAAIASVAHEMETILGRLRQGQLALRTNIIDGLLAGADMIQTLLDDAKNAERVNIEPLLQRLQDVLLTEQPQSLSSPKIASVVATLPDTADVEKPAPRPTGAEGPSTVRINVQILDRLMTLAGELVLVRNQAIRAADVSEPQQMRQVVQRLNSITTDVQQAVLLTRMQPVSNLFGKFPRLVRDLSKRLNKQIELTMLGAEVELDKSILESLSDPLTHLVRNSCDHGIEPPADRVAAGKSPEGHILLQAHHEGGQIRIEIRDDGRGIDPAVIRRKALEKGLKTAAELQAMSDADVHSLILLPGFSMAERVTELSGRGVGMDVVKTNLEQLGGSLQIESRPGAGTCMHLRLPLTLAIIPCLLVKSGGERYAIPQRDLEELVCIASDQVAAKLERSFDQEVYRLRGRLLPLVRLSEVLNRPTPFTAEVRAEITRKEKPPGHLFLAVVKVGMQRLGLIVEELLNTEEIVVKPMHSALKSLRCFSGATILGDGRVALILDVEGIARHAGIAHEASRWSAETSVSGEDEKQTILLFKYGPEEQFAVPLALVRRIEEIHVSRIERAGKGEFITIQGQTLPIVRLDRYLQVSPAVEREKMYLLLPKFFQRPAGILLTQLLDTETRSVQLDTNSLREDCVMGTAVLRDRMTIFLDLFRLNDRFVADQHVAEAGKPQGSESRPRILLVEDTQFFRTLVQGYLEDTGYVVTTAENGMQALGKLASAPYDLIVSDIEMPEMDGWRLAREVREKLGLRDLPLLALTTLNSERDRQHARECGFDGYEVKVDRESFLASVARLLNRSATAERGVPVHG